ncbi:hypothetical protein SAMN05216228_1009185 [Rhizobium tibeticum]|uniref:Uncharacterized protein n=1 Tax=Rhizobium tibeticum TaxID=501024 RepID=A0A1H8KTA4_9HYPH|nr:hypothetical protein [Rhizobium tibeticum]SEH83825.1 hypothetical protein RTCCBAU85039_2638 [Rhizobium tibeticum]SEN96051.1 hypothetical protein SAMN05216228_1009185 [Rhizobium tibeticum]
MLADQFVAQRAARGGALHDETALVEFDRSIDGIVCELAQEFPDRRIATPIKKGLLVYGQSHEIRPPETVRAMPPRM